MAATATVAHRATAGAEATAAHRTALRVAAAIRRAVTRSAVILAGVVDIDKFGVVGTSVK